MSYGDDHHPDLAYPLQTQRPIKIYCVDCQGKYGKCWCVGGDIGKKKMTDTTDELKETNPKDAVGIKKAPITTVSGAVLAELGLAMMEGALKYGRHNYRIAGVRASVYRDSVWRHLLAWWDFGQDIDPDSGLSHITKAIAGLMVLRDGMILGNLVDDRPPPMPIELLKEYDKMAAALIEKYPNPKPAFTHYDVKKKVENEEGS